MNANTEPSPPLREPGVLARLAKGAARALTGLSGGWPSGVFDLDAAELSLRIDVPMLTEAPESDEWEEIEAGFAILADQGLWISVLDRLRGVDQSRQQFASGRRYYECALSGALSPVTRHLKPPARIADAVTALSVFETVHAAYPKDYMSAVLLARALIDIGAAVRGPLPPSKTPSRAMDEARRYYSRAEMVLEPFDPIEENSPVIAETRYMLAPGLRDGADYLRDWYEDWADLDPSNANILVTHCRSLMPDWNGDLEEIELEARAAVARAEDGLGPGAYAFFWRHALDTDVRAMEWINADLLLEGIHQTLSLTMSQYLANRFAAHLCRLTKSKLDDDESEPPRTAAARARLSEGLNEVLRRHLREIHLPLWQPLREAAIRVVVADAFAAELQDGLIIRPGTAGLTGVRAEQSA